jgi:hypothetical protein
MRWLARALLSSALCVGSLIPFRHAVPADAPRFSLAFMTAGPTTRGQVQAHIGLPFVTFQDGRIWVYRFDGTPDTGFVHSYPGQYHLVLVFDSDDRLRRHGLVKVRP